MNSLQKKIIGQLGETTQSGVADFSEPAFVATEMRSLNNGLKSHLYFTIFFNLTFTFQLWSALNKHPDTHGIISIIIPILGMGVCLYFYKTWIDKKRKLALLQLLDDSYAGQVEIETWFNIYKKLFNTPLFSTKTLEKQAKANLNSFSSTKLLFLITQIILFTLFFLNKATEGSSLFIAFACFYMIFIPILFIDWRLSIYYFSLKLIWNEFNN